MEFSKRFPRYKKVYDNTGEFKAFEAAERWCKENCFSVGQMCGKSPIGLLKGNAYIAKWRNLNAYERSALHGTITGDMRNGPVTVEIF